MEILNSGSFIPLDNREKIEQLIFTAQTLASEVGRSEGFQSNGQSNQQIGLELWKGAEYMTRAHEEVTIRNIFLSKFLEKLREIYQRTVNNIPTQRPQTAEPLVATNSSILEETPTETAHETPREESDEFLGLVDTRELAEERPSYANECKPECEEEIVSMLGSTPENLIEEPTIEPISDEDLSQIPVGEADTELTGPQDSTASDSGVEIKVEPDLSSKSSGDAASEVSTEAEPLIQSIVLSEKEPYNFDSCTITAVIQLLPQTNGARNCVLSVRSHDFPPQITFTSCGGESGRMDLRDSIDTAIEQYRNSLPALAAEKLKKEQRSTKKRTPKVDSKSPDKATDKTETNFTESPASTPVSQQPARDQQTLFAS